MKHDRIFLDPDLVADLIRITGMVTPLECVNISDHWHFRINLPDWDRLYFRQVDLMVVRAVSGGRDLPINAISVRFLLRKLGVSLKRNLSESFSDKRETFFTD